MRFVLIILFSALFIHVKAQVFTPVNSFGYTNNIFPVNRQFDSTHKKLFVTHYIGVTAGYAFFRGGGASFMAAPVTFQLNKELNKNLYAFGNVSVAPTYTNFNQAFLNTNFNKVGNNAFYKANNFNLQSSATLGLMYVNDAKTFSISGGISIERNNYPVYYSNQTKQVNNNRSYK